VTDIRAALRRIAEPLPPGSPVNLTLIREELLELVQAHAPPHVDPADWTLKRLADRWDRKAGTIRLWCEMGRILGAYKFRDREWRIPHARMLEYEEQQRHAATDTRAGDVGDLSDYRNHLPKAG
jgi:hypothetical protein